MDEKRRIIANTSEGHAERIELGNKSVPPRPEVRKTLARFAVAFVLFA